MSSALSLDEGCFYTVLHASKENHERILLDVVAPIVREIRGNQCLDSFFFVRFEDPEPQLRFRVLGRTAWIEKEVRERIERALAPVVASGIVRTVEFGKYDREWERYGGPEGMRLAERIFLHDSAACLELIAAESRGGLAGSRREYSLVHTERLLDLLGFDRGARLAFYKRGQQWAFGTGGWTEEDRAMLDARYERVRDGIRDLLVGEASHDPRTQLGGEEPARISGECIEATRLEIDRLLVMHAEGLVRQDLVNLAWSYAHMHCNRLGIENPAEAILRYFMHRYYEEVP